VRSYKSNLYVDTFVTVAFYCIYVCIYFVHSCVWQLFLKSKRWDERWEHATVDRYLLPTGHSAANGPATAAAAVYRWDRHTDKRTDDGPLHGSCSAYYAHSVSRPNRQFLPARRYASAGIISHGPVSVCLCLSVCHNSEFYRNGWTNRAGFWHGSFLTPVLTVSTGNSAHSKNKSTSPGTLSQHTVSASTLQSFKRHLKTFLLQHLCNILIS